jgi:AcrR family transcriptional regulator
MSTCVDSATARDRDSFDVSLGEIIERKRKSAADTRGAMLRAARRRFLNESYENVGLRDIARDVGVDVALVSRYFGSKEELFRQVLHGEQKFNANVPPMELPDYLVSLLAEKDVSSDGEHIEKMLISLRSASSPVASRLVREAIQDDVLEPLAKVLGGPDAGVRASLILAILMGTTVLRTIMSVEPLCDGCPDTMRARLLGLFEAALA